MYSPLPLSQCLLICFHPQHFLHWFVYSCMDTQSSHLLHHPQVFHHSCSAIKWGWTVSLFHLWNWGRDISLLACNPLTNCKTCMCIDLAVSLLTIFQVVSFHTFVLQTEGFISWSICQFYHTVCLKLHLHCGKMLSYGQIFPILTVTCISFCLAADTCMATNFRKST